MDLARYARKFVAASELPWGARYREFIEILERQLTAASLRARVFFMPPKYLLVTPTCSGKEVALAIRRLGTRLESTGDDVLQLIVPGREYSFDYMLDGLVQHSAYHAGQIAMLKRAGENPS